MPHTYTHTHTALLEVLFSGLRVENSALLRVLFLKRSTCKKPDSRRPPDHLQQLRSAGSVCWEAGKAPTGPWNAFFVEPRRVGQEA